MIKWAAHGDVADVPLCGLVSLFLPNTLPQYTLRYDTRMLWVMASFPSRCPCEQARDSPIQSLSRFIHKLPSPLLPMYDTSFCHFLGYHSAITLSDARCPHVFFSSILEVAITYMIFLLSTSVLRKGIDHQWYILTL